MMEPSHQNFPDDVDESHTDDSGMNFDPRALLNPAAAHRASPQSERSAKRTRSPVARLFSPRNASQHSRSPSSRASDEVQRSKNGDVEAAPKIASMIESMHGLAERQDVPRKRVKVETDGDKPKSHFSGGSGKGGVISEHLKTARSNDGSPAPNEVFIPYMPSNHTARESPPAVASEAIGSTTAQDTRQAAEVVNLMDDDDNVDTNVPGEPANGVIDLTEDGPDDQNGTDASEVCFGMISGARVNAWKTPSPSSKAVKFTSKVWPGIKCTLHRRAGRDNAIAVKDAMDKEFGKLDIRVSHGLVPLMDAKVFTLRTESRIPPRRRREFEHAAGVCSDAIPISVILYGPFHQAAGVGQFLSQRNIFLQHPGSFTKGHYYNPQEERKNFGPRGPGTNYVSNTPTRSAEEAEADLANLFDRMPNADNLPEAEPSATVKTLLLQHQKQALSFMLDHEDPAMEEDQIALWKMTTKPNGKKVWRSVVTDQESDKAPQAVRGGILADMMGLGKTLSVLALIASTTGQAASWAREADTERKRIPATLLICPLSVVSNWEEQVGTHLKKGSLRCYVYHGANRSSDRKTFAMQNVIITTYNIVSSELFGRGDRTRTGSPFSRFKFFRIVLDEAHMIREQSTFISRAACELAGSRHWALTGTPIQNRLDDLASLLRFLRVAPFEDTSNFTRYVLTPFKMANPDILMKLRLLVDSLTLRRTKDRINLPKRVDQVVKLTFSDEEKAIYDAYQKDGKNRLQAVSSQKDKLAGKGMAHVLRSILILRLLACSKVLLNEEDKEVLQGLSSSTAINVEEDKPAITTRTGYEMLKLCQETGSDMCASCGRQLRGKETVDETVLGFILPCYQLVCNDCVQQVSDEIESRTRDERLTCPMCSEFIKPELLKLTQEGLDDAEEQKAMLKANPRRTKLINPQDGDYQASTKTAALISALLDSRETNRANPTRDPIKSVVFSTWTSHLDLLEIELDSHDFTYVRLDGKMTRTKRAESLRAFREDLGVELILVSLGAGGLGLNLTAGSRVYMMEPQFNPAAEAQAIDRVHRLGQKQHVVCTRFIMEDSIEEAIQELQLKKATLAELSLGKGKVDRAEAARKKLESLKSLFR